MSIHIRNATAADAALLTDLGRRSFTAAFETMNTPENFAAYLAEAFNEQKQAEEVAQPGSIFLIAETQDPQTGQTEPVGYARLLAGSTETCITGKNPIELVRIYALGTRTGKGIGSALIQAVVQEARGRGHDVIWLGVWQENPRAVAFYERWGFQKVGTHVFQLGNDPQTDWIMQRGVGDA